MTWIESAGGPLVLIPRLHVSEWGGASLDTPMVGDDYERACAITDYIGGIPVGDGTALVLGDTPDRTTVIDSEFGIALLRWGFADSADEWLEVARSTLGEAEVVEEMTYRVTESAHLLIDSAWAGADYEEFLEFSLPKGYHSVSTRRHSSPRVEYLAHLFVSATSPVGPTG